MAGFRPGLGRGGITHSLEVTDPGVPGPGDGEMVGLAAIAGANGAGVGAGAIEGAGVAILFRIASLFQEELWVEVSGSCPRVRV